MRFMIFIALLLSGASAMAAERVLVQSTTSTQNSGLYAYLLPMFEAETGLRVDVVAVGTGQAIRNAQRGDGDLLIVHDRVAEDAFVAAGDGIERRNLMYNDFVFIGPSTDPAKLAEARTTSEVLARIAGGAAPFLSRGDDSGTHRAELRFWKAAGLDPKNFGPWYRETGSGMGATIRVALEMQGYALTDRGTWLSYQRKGDHRILFQGDPPLFNHYGVILVNPARHPYVNVAGARRLMDWLTGEEGQRAIAAFKVEDEQLFFPEAGRGD